MATDSAKSEKFNLLSKAVALLGAALFGLGMLWPMFESSANHWTPEQVEEYSSASRALHRSASGDHNDHAHAGHDRKGHHHASGAATDLEDLKQARARFEEINQQLDLAKEAPQLMAGRMKTIGGVLLVVGAAAIAICRRKP